MASAASHGFSVADFEYITIGMLADALSEFIPEKQRIRKASQADMDKL